MTQAQFPFQKGLCVSAIYPAAITDAAVLRRALSRMAESGFYTAAEFYHEGPDAQLDGIAAHCAGLGLSVVYLAGFTLKRQQLDIASPNEAARRKAVAACKALLRSAKRLGAEKMLILSGPSKPGRAEQSVVECAVRSIRELIEQGERAYGPDFPQITVEFFNPHGDPFLSVGTPSIMLEIAAQIGSGHFGITFDTSHVAQMGLGLMETLTALHPYVTHLHLANSVSRYRGNALYGDKHPPFDIPQGDLTTADIRSFLAGGLEHRLLTRVGICSAEVISRGAGSEDACYAQVLGQMQTIFPSHETREETQPCK